MKVIDRKTKGSFRLKYLAPFLLAIFFCENAANCQTITNISSNGFDVHKWVGQHFAKGKVPPFSFVYGGKSSDNFIRNWQFSAEKMKSTDPNVEESVYTYSDEQSGLVVKCFITCFNDFQAVEWVLRFTNSANQNSPIIKQVRSIDYLFVSDQMGPFRLYHSEGSSARINDFEPLTDELQIGKSIYMTPVGGRSSDNGGFPFFNIETPGKSGIMVAIGWTGKWYADVRKLDEKSVSLKSGMEKIQLKLFPKEEIRTPKICLLFWEGEDRMIGHNQFRQFILVHHTPKRNGKFVALPFSVQLGHGAPSPCNEHTCETESNSIAEIERHKYFNIVPEAFWLDAGWYLCHNSWPLVGNWVVNSNNFPNGLKPVTDASHKAGAEFILWFEPERVTEGTQVANKNSEWLLKLSGSNNMLFNLGNTEARLWMTDLIANIIKNEGIDCYRQDFNLDPMPYWEANDKPDRIGISEIRHIEGLYAFWDSLLVRFPNLYIDNCASGGRRIDLETTSRSLPLWRSDYVRVEPNGPQCQTYGLNFYLPLHGTGMGNNPEGDRVSKYWFRSTMSSGINLVWDVNSPKHTVPELQKYIQEFKRLRPYFYEDYYPLTEYSTSADAWLAYQLNRPKLNDGVIFAFRRQNSRDEAITIRLRGLDEKNTYEFFYEDYEIKAILTGAELMKGINIAIPDKYNSLLISYKKQNN